MRRILAAAILGAGTVATPAVADDASFGCKVLLCAAATVPGWPGIAYCVPVMQQLFRQLAKGQPWPTCPEGNASSVGYEPAEACPAGSSPATASTQATLSGAATAYAADPNGSLCVSDTYLRAIGCTNDAGSQCGPIPSADVTQRVLHLDQPYYVDIGVGGTSTRFRFNLER